ncbi:MAG: porin, partial [Planctomycetaceae bacterium]
RTIAVAGWLITAGCLTVSTAQDTEPRSAINISHIDQKLESLQSQIDALRHVNPPGVNAFPAPQPHSPEWPTSSLTGLIQTDLGYFQQDAASRAAVGDIQDGADFRRVRVGVKGKVWHSTSYMIEMEYANLNRVAFTDVFLQRDGDHMNIRLGRWRQPFGMAALTSVKELSFIERSSTFGFVPFRQTGLGAFGTWCDEQGTWAVSGFRTESDAIGGSLGDDGGWGLASRTTYLLADDPSQHQLVHMGFDYSLIAPPDDSLRFSSRPEAFLAEVGVSRIPDFVDTGSIATESASLFALEAAFQSGPLHGQSEYFYTTLDSPAGGSIHFQGAYSQLVYSLTGETRPYSRKQGVFTRPAFDNSVDCGGSGAWELAARWSWIDLDDTGIAGGELTTLTAGVNWYLNPHCKLQFNYINAAHDTGGTDAQTNLFVTRAQLDF